MTLVRLVLEETIAGATKLFQFSSIALNSPAIDIGVKLLMNNTWDGSALYSSVAW